MKVAIITKSATTKSGARAPFELALALENKCDLTIFAESKNSEQELKKKYKNLKLYTNPTHLYQLLKAGRFSVISFHATLAEMIAAKLTGIPIAATYYGTQFDAYLEKNLPEQKPSLIDLLVNQLTNKAIWIIKKLQMSLANKNISISAYTQRELKNLYGVKSTVIYLGPSTNLKPTTNNQRSSSNHSTILTVSRLTPYKGFHILIETINKLRAQGLDLKLIIVGSSQKKNYLRYLKKIKYKEDQIILDADDKTLAVLYRSCDIYATCDRYLFFGLPIVEAASFSKPVVILNNKAASELIVHKKTGYIADSKDELEEYLRILLKNKRLRKQLGEQAKIYSEKKFNWKKIALQYQQIFQNLHKLSNAYSDHSK